MPHIFIYHLHTHVQIKFPIETEEGNSESNITPLNAGPGESWTKGHKLSKKPTKIEGEETMGNSRGRGYWVDRQGGKV